MRSKITLATLTAAGALVAFPAVSQAALFIDAKSFSTQEATSLARSTIATFSDDHTPATPCDASGYTSTVDWGDGSPVEPATVTFRFGGDFTCASSPSPPTTSTGTSASSPRPCR